MKEISVRSKVCCFTGHRYIPRNFEKILIRQTAVAIEKLLSKGVSTFLSGGAVGFDLMAATVVLDIKKRFPGLSLVMVLPCKDQSERWSIKDKKLYNYVLSEADEVIYLSEKYCTGCMHKRNRVMVENSGYCVSYYTVKSGGTAHTIGLAKEQELVIFNMAESLIPDDL